MISLHVKNGADRSTRLPDVVDEAPAASDDRELVPAPRTSAAPVVRKGELGSLVQGVTQAFGQLESACSAFVVQVLDSQTRMEKAEKRAADVAAEAEAAVQRARLEAQVEINELRASVDQLRGDLQNHRDRLRAICEQPEDADTETPITGDDRIQGQLAVYRKQLFAVTEELEASRVECAELTRRLNVERANRARLMAAVQALHQSSILYEPVRIVEQVDRPPFTADSLRAIDPAPAPERAEAAASAPAPVAHEAAADATQVVEKPGLAFDLGQYARQLLDDIETMHAADYDAGIAASELVERLTCNLRYGAQVFMQRVGFDVKYAELFHRQIAQTLDTKGGTVFGRHLAVAAYEYEQRKPAAEVA